MKVNTKKTLPIILLTIVILLITSFAIEAADTANNSVNELHQTKSDTTRFKNGRWISTTDSLEGINIKDGKWILFYKGTETDSTDIYNCSIGIGTSIFADSRINSDEFITLTNPYDTLKFELFSYTDSTLNLYCLSNRTLLRYIPEK